MRRYIYIVFTLALLLAVNSCEDFLTTKPLGVTSEEVFYSEKGVNALLTGAYAHIDGCQATDGGLCWAGAVSNWVFGSVASDNSYKGTSFTDQSSINPIERWEVLTENNYPENRWRQNYDGIERVNNMLKVMAQVDASALSDAKRSQYKAQALFLRAWFHFELKRSFDNIPYITEDVEDPGAVSNTIDAWPLIEADLTYAYQNLPNRQTEVGRANKWAAAAVLARVHLFQNDFTAAETLLDDIINNGGFTLVTDWHDNGRISGNNNSESIFEIQYAVNDGSYGSSSAGWGDCLNFPQSGDMGLCCGFHQPSQNFVNAFKVDANGLPLLDTFNDTDLKSDQGVLSSETFVPFTDVVDPRLDMTVGRRGIPVLDWGIMRGKDWIREQPNGGPYIYKKNLFYESEKNSLSTTTGWAVGVNANNFRAYRLAHVYLWKAECAAQRGDLATALDYVNRIRNRAKNSPVVMGLCTMYELPSIAAYEGYVDYDQPAANYMVEPYPSFPDQAYALKAIRHEMRLEFGMEGHRFFDLIRWGIAEQTLNAFAQADTRIRSFMQGAVFNSNHDEYMPIPQSQIDISVGALVQNPGY